MPAIDPSSRSAGLPEDLLQVAQEYADLFNARALEEVDELIDDACVDPYWDDRTNWYSLVADEPENLALVLALHEENYVVVRFVDEWVVDTSPVDWEALEHRAFDPQPEGDHDYDGFPA